MLGALGTVLVISFITVRKSGWIIPATLAYFAATVWFLHGGGPLW